nr:hypothetical protein [Kibdelosporangium sp. MJ126-NF4]CEL23003.1 hypothetical protein [Kibdelosporangium sp. MJ126-NF4]CTQ90143.1 hypothetical protein [Kibdelosporangium sp. MJ126-NF4]
MPTEEDDQPARFGSELIRASTPAIYGRSWIPYLRLLLLLVVLTATVIGVREVLSPSPATTSTVSER